MTPADAVVVSLVSGASLAVAAWTYLRAGGPRRSRLGWAALAFVGSGLTALAFAALWLEQPHDPWNAARLTPAVGMHHGFKLYYPMQEGPVLSTVVGPVAFLAYWPVGFLPGSPTLLILAGCALNVAALAGLGAWIVRHVAPSPLHALLGGLLGAQLCLHYPSLRYSLVAIHADAPALLLGGLGAGLLLTGAGLPSWRRCAAIALCLSLAVWAKQSLAPIFPAVLLLAWLRDGLGTVGRLTLVSAAVGAALSLGFVGWLGFRELWDNMFAVPALHPWRPMNQATGEIYADAVAVGVFSHLKAMTAAALAIVRANWFLFAFLAIGLVQQLRSPAPANRRWPREPWAGFLLVAFFLFPTAALGRSKVGGDINHESFVVFFLVLSLVCAALAAARRAPDGHRLPIAIALVTLLIVNVPRAIDYRGWQAAWNNQNEIALRYERAHPNAVYFPWNPLTPLLASGQLQHFDYGVFDRNLGGAPVTAAHLQQHLPSPRPVIASYRAHQDYLLRTCFSDYVERPRVPELPGWRLYGPGP